MPWARIAVICLIRGRSTAIASWQIMQVRTLGRPATGPVVTLSWQYSVHAVFFATCTMCGKSIGRKRGGGLLREAFIARPSFPQSAPRAKKHVEPRTARKQEHKASE